jgi:Domain of unknown function (DUF4832)
MMPLARIILASIVIYGSILVVPAATNSYSLVYAPAPLNNPLKGFMPYSGSYTTFPYSMEWNYLPLRSLMTGPTNFNWSSLDQLLSNVASRGHQTVFRIYLDYPTLSTGIPQYLLDAGLITHSYNDYGNNGASVSPDYENPLLDQALTNFIAAFGARYDGDPRIGFITVGLLGYWGEWHTYPETQWFASVAVQEEVLTAYANAFSKTKLLVRWPSGASPPAQRIGYHDDSFAHQTIDPPSYMFLALLKAAGETNKWQTQPIGGEVYPPEQSCIWDTNQPSCVPAGQDFNTCVKLTHASWMINQGVFSPGFTGAQKALALAGTQQLGYELYVTNAQIVDARLSGALNISLQLQNTGVAPFYYSWPVQIGVLNASNTLVQTWTTPWMLTSILPNSTNTVWSYSQSSYGLAVGPYKLALRVQNPLTNGVLFHFANQSQDADVVGWLTLGQFSILTNIAQPTLNGVSALPNFVLQVSNAAPGAWTVERTSDLVVWTPLLTTNTSSAGWNFTDEVSSVAQFYRVVSQP